MSSHQSLFSRYVGNILGNRKALSRSARLGKRRSARLPLGVEALESRTLPSFTISVSDSSAIEGSNALRFIDRFVAEGSGGLTIPRLPLFGPDGNGDGAEDLYVASADTHQILLYDGRTGSFLRVFVASGSGGLNSPVDPAFGPDGRLYVSSFGSGEVLRYDGSTGAFIDRVASGLSEPLGLTFGNDGNLYIANHGADNVVRYDGSTLSVFVSAGSGGLDNPRQAVFGPDRYLYVASGGTKQVLRYDGQTGSFIDVFATTAVEGLGGGPAWLEFGADGYLYATARTTAVCCNTSVVRFDSANGAFVDTFPLGRDGWAFILGQDGLVYNSSHGQGNSIDRLGPSSLVAFTVSLSSPSAVPVTVNYATADGTALAGSDYTAASGTLTFAPGVTSLTVLVATIDNALGEPTETFTVTLSDPVGGTIGDGQGVATILDNETKFYVIDDAAPDRTHEYGSGGVSVQSYSLDGGNNAPRGAAADTAGSRLWVLDANKKVYVYTPGGALLGSWRPALTGNSPQGIATDGTHIWIVEAGQDKVYRYANAAGRLSGGQKPIASFNLAGGNTNPRGIVTDGVHLWVVDDGATDRVFKYTLAGVLVGSWTIDAANASPTGITLDPTDVRHLWIVDNGSDRVYQYDDAAGRTGGSQAASLSFALAAGNTNPQDIADPPASNRKTRGAEPLSAAADLGGYAPRLDDGIGFPAVPLPALPGLPLGTPEVGRRFDLALASILGNDGNAVVGGLVQDTPDVAAFLGDDAVRALFELDTAPFGDRAGP